MQACGRLIATIVEVVGSISTMILAAMRKITCRRIYQVLAWLCFLLLCIYVAFALIFALCTTVVAAQAMSAMWVSAFTYESISLAAAFAVGLCFWIPFILYCCRHLLLLYMQIVTPIIAAVLVCAGEITMPTYMSLWSMLISYQVCSLVVSGSCTIPLISRIAGTIAITIMGPATALSLSLWCILLVCLYTIVCCMGAILLLIIYPWTIKKNYTLRWRRLLLYGGQSYRTILLCFAWLFQARPLYIACFFICLCILSKLAITSPMQRQLDPLEILRDMRQGGSTINVPIPHVIFLSLCNILMGASIWRIMLSGFTISAWYFKYHFQENYCKAISQYFSCMGVLVVSFSYPDVRRGYETGFRQEGQK